MCQDNLDAFSRHLHTTIKNLTPRSYIQMDLILYSTPHGGDPPCLPSSPPQPPRSLLLRFLRPPQEMGRELNRWARRHSSARMVIAHDHSAGLSIKNAMS